MNANTDLSTKELIDPKTGLTVTFYRREDRGRWYAEICHSAGLDEPYRLRRSTGTADARVAIERAREIAADAWREIQGGIGGEIRAALLAGRQATWAEAIELYEVTELPRIERRNPHYASGVRAALSYLKAILPLGDPVLDGGPALVRRLVDIMETGTIHHEDGSATPVITVGPDGREKTRGPARPRTIRSRLGVLSRVVECLREATITDGEYLITRNPIRSTMRTCWPALPPDDQPVLSDRRFRAMLDAAPEVERTTRSKPWQARGRVACSLALLRWHGRRRGEVARLRIGSVYLDRDALQEALVLHGYDPEWADEWIYGAVLWDRANNKQARRYDRARIAQDQAHGRISGILVPLSERLHQLLTAYLHGHPLRDNPEAPLFPSMRKPAKSIDVKTLNIWWKKLEAAAGIGQVDQGGPHAARRLFRSERAQHIDAKLIAIVAGWWNSQGTNRREAMNGSYLQFGPRAIFAAVEFDPARDLEPEGLVAGVGVPIQWPEEHPAAAQMRRRSGSDAESLRRRLLELPEETLRALLAATGDLRETGPADASS